MFPQTTLPRQPAHLSAFLIVCKEESNLFDHIDKIVIASNLLTNMKVLSEIDIVLCKIHSTAGTRYIKVTSFNICEKSLACV